MDPKVPQVDAAMVRKVHDEMIDLLVKDLKEYTNTTLRLVAKFDTKFMLKLSGLCENDYGVGYPSQGLTWETCALEDATAMFSEGYIKLQDVIDTFEKHLWETEYQVQERTYEMMTEGKPYAPGVSNNLVYTVYKLIFYRFRI